ncbi:oligomeric Golgi complex component [Heterostelium album PN500]|uniref:Conserved oligomeric Golgi complex subunit 2 n=1 Tax=Heterostelium pallidum (strain ATCC 26659 / Pp 5 / PN500) TaxID=670386 RepID=D3BKL8_HETP5|nr:oligomeric Golgi complex component [Heterostelium album PN500]EFA78448.1 oligomeric Golgi complex component [Heterostelium album PN500]|eukprot:XP_020430573.1 oligomeric Golgi complex component [Heterostelium album PN500]
MNRNYSFDSSLNSSGNIVNNNGLNNSSSSGGGGNTAMSYQQPTIIGGQYNPLCFSKEVFVADTFKVDQFIADCRKRVPLESVQKDLREYSKCLDTELVELINREYHSFFSLSSSLVGIDVVLNEFNDTLSSIKSEITTFKGDIHKVRECVEDKLREKKQIDHTKQLLQLYISISESITHIHNLFDQLSLFNNTGQPINSNSLSPTTTTTIISSSSSSTSTTAAKNTTLTLELVIERISNTFYQIQNQLLTLSSEESKLKIFQQLNMKLLELSNQIESKIEPIFTETLRCIIKVDSEIVPNTIVDILFNCLKLYQVIKKLSLPYKIFRKTIVKPHLSSIINIKNLEGNNKGSCDGLSTIYQQIKSFLNVECLSFRKLCSKVNELFISSKYNFVSESLMPELEEQFALLKPIYATGIPDLFFKTFMLSCQFVATLEETMFDSVEQLRDLRQSPSYANFFKRWNFAIYFQLRFSEIAQQLERSLSQTTCYDTIANLQNPQVEQHQFHLSQTTSLCVTAAHCWSSSIFIYELSSKFFRLFLQLIQRYEHYVLEAVQHIESPNKSNIVTTSPITTTTTTTTPSSNITSPTVASPTTTSTSTLSTQQQQDQRSINKYTPQENLVYLYSDILKLIDKINNEFKPMVTKAINNPLKEIEDLINNSLSESVKSLQSILQRISIIIVNHFTSKCSEGLSFINSLTTTYRLTNKPMPTKPSTYVQLLVNPFESFLSNKANSIPSTFKSQWSNDIFIPISEKFYENANGVLSSFSKADEILNKLKKKTTAASSTTTPPVVPTHNTDYDKMSLQLYLDVIKYGQLIQKTGVDVDNSANYQKLLQLVEPFKKYLV